MKKSIMLSIYPPYWELISDGFKNVELRKSPQIVTTPTECFWYVTSPVKGVLGRSIIHPYVSKGLAEDDAIVYSMFHLELTRFEIKQYLDEKIGYLYPIESTEVFDKEYNISDFGLKNAPQSWCSISKYPEDIKSWNDTNI